jgi:hypothetical protein
MASTPTASDQYDQHCQDIARVMDWIELELDKHKANAKANPKDWGYPGDLGHVREKLIETLAFLSNREPQDIENLLSECR